jgi:hypothetical protein
MPFRMRLLTLERLLTPERLRRIGICIFVTNVVLYSLVVALGHFPSDALHGVVAQDFLGHLTGGILLATGKKAQLYDVQAQYALQVALTHRPEYVEVFISPPLVAYLYAPFALLGYGGGLVVWLALTVGMLVASGLVLLRLMPSVPRQGQVLVLLLAAASHPAIQLLGSGQDTAISLLLWSAGVLLALRGRGAASGLVFSLGLFKPQLFALPPLLFLVWGRKRALGVWTASALAQVGLTLALVGEGGVRAWLGILRSPAYLDFLQDKMAYKMTSLAPFFRSLVPAPWGGPARAVGGVLSVALAAAAVWCVRRPVARAVDERVAWALACLTTLVASPHLFYYDLTLAVLPLALFVEAQPELSLRFRRALLAAYVLCWLAPLREAFIDFPWPVNILGASWLPIPLFVLWLAMARAAAPAPPLRELPVQLRV